MNYSKIKVFDIANGPGLRVSVWVCGCSLHCKGCFNEELWDFDSGSLWGENEEKTVINMLNSPQISGLSILGGEPLLQKQELRDFLCRVKTHTQYKDIWMWTGFDVVKSHRELTKGQLEILKYVDVLVDGPYIESLNKGTHRFRGSANQRIWRHSMGMFKDITEEIDENKYGTIEIEGSQTNILGSFNDNYEKLPDQLKIKF